MLTAMPAGAEVEVSAGLDGYYRVGRYMPMRVRASVQGVGAGANIRIGTEGAMESWVALESGKASGVAPLLPLVSVRQVGWIVKDGNRPTAAAGTVRANWRGLGADERLVGFTAIDVEIAKKLFPDKTIIPIQLDSQDPLPGPAVAWEAMDAVVFDSAPRLDGEKIGELLATGMTVAIRSAAKPAGPWGWREVNGYWVAQVDVRGPRIAGDNSGAFAPVQGWRADWPAAFRWRVMLYGAGFAILAAGAALVVRRGWAGLAVVVVSVGTVAALWGWWRGRSAVLERGTDVVVLLDGATQVDQWNYRAAASRAADRAAWSGNTRPIFEMGGWSLVKGMRLICDEDGNPAYFQYEARPGFTVAFLSRAIAGGRHAVDARESALPLELLAKRSYLRRGDRVVGVAPPAAGTGAEWSQTLVIEGGNLGER